jgi:hypothetical protein
MQDMDTPEKDSKDSQAVAQTELFVPGGYRFIKAVFQYSGGVVAMPGYRIVRVQFSELVPLDEGFSSVEAFLKKQGRPLTSFCQCELRSPAPFTEDGFRSFNEQYSETLKRWSLFDGTTNPVARSNVCPVFDPPEKPSIFAFSYTEPDADAAPSFIVAGGAEAPEGRLNYRDHIVRLGDLSDDAIAEKARFVLDEMERRMAALGFNWSDTTGTNVYTIHDLYSIFVSEMVQRGAARSGVTWQYCRPPVVDLEFEMDCRGVSREIILRR